MPVDTRRVGEASGGEMRVPGHRDGGAHQAQREEEGENHPRAGTAAHEPKLAGEQKQLTGNR